MGVSFLEFKKKKKAKLRIGHLTLIRTPVWRNLVNISKAV